MNAILPVPVRLNRVLSRAFAPRKVLTVSEWADTNRFLSSKGSAEPGRWRTSRNPPLREPMDCFSVRSPVRDVVCRFPIQLGKTEVEVNVVGYTMCENPGPIMVVLPSEVSLSKWVEQKLNPMLEESPAVKRTLTSVASRDAANRRTFKDFIGGQLYLEHAGNPQRLKSTSVRTLVVDEFAQFASLLKGGDDPDLMLDGRTSGFPSTSKRLKVGSPEILGTCRVTELFEKSDQRFFHVKCPHCAHEQPLEWSGLQWTPDLRECWYVCREHGCVIQEHEKTAMIAAGRWIPRFPDRPIRGYHLNCLYYQLGLGPRWLELARMWIDSQNDPGRLKTFINDRLAEPWEDKSLTAVKHNILADRAEPYRLRTAPLGVLVITAGVDTQDNRLAVHIIGWGIGLTCWVLDYIEIPGDPADDDVWTKLTDLLNRPIEHALGTQLRVQATAIDMGGHRTEAVKHFVRQRRIRRPMAIFGSTRNNCPVLKKPQLQDVNWKGQLDKKGVHTHEVGTVAIKHLLYSRIAVDAEREAAERMVHISEELEPSYFGGLVSETYNPTKNRFEKRRGAPRNEPLDTWAYAYAATHHHELRLHRFTKADWAMLEGQVLASVGQPIVDDSRETPPAQRVADQTKPAAHVSRETSQRTKRSGIDTRDGWGL